MVDEFEAMLDRHYAILDAQIAGGMDCAVARHRDEVEGGPRHCRAGWCEMCFWHPKSLWWPGKALPEWYKPPPVDLFSWAAQ
jgi:hypothetical protein